MFITINCLGLPFDGDTVKTKSLGGSESAAYYMALELRKLGHEVTVFSNTDKGGTYDGVRYLSAGPQTEQAPLGQNFHVFAENTPHDVCIIQRHPHAFRFKWASKINLWWVHDLGLMRMRGDVMQHMWNIDGVITVSEFHKQQYIEVYGLNPEVIFPVENGVDPALFAGVTRTRAPDGKTHLIYISRPERGLEHLVKPNGIMEKLGEDYHLSVCAYDNTTAETEDYYNYLWGRCESLPNVTNLGFLSKPALAQALVDSDAMIYPTPGPFQPTFEEVSCIAAMEAMHAGIPLITSAAGALPETCAHSGTILLPLVNGLPDIDAFVEAAERINPTTSAKQLDAAERFTWKESAEKLMKVVYKLLAKNRSAGAIDTHLIEQSDIYAYRLRDTESDRISKRKRDEFKDCYSFIYSDSWKAHYDAYYEYEKERGVNYGPESLEGNNRFEHISGLIGTLPAGSSVLDYGCAHGHYTVNLARRFPELQFYGMDITATNIDKARAWAASEGLTNVGFTVGSQADIGTIEERFRAIIAAEVIEHVAAPQALVDSLAALLTDDGKMIVSTPFGPWEAQGYMTHWPWRAHVHHFDRADVLDAFGHHPEFRCVSAPGGHTMGQPVGSYIYSFGRPVEPSRDINYGRKLSQLAPRQTVSLCMILKESEDSILSCLRSVVGVVDEVIIGFDKTGRNDLSLQICERFCIDNLIPAEFFDIESPVSIGFDEARNQTISKACGDWILWLDSDEELINGKSLLKFLRNNQFNGYAIPQDHYATEPAGVLKQDFPVKLFRNRVGIKFYGVVHEHPETEINKGVGHAQILPEVKIAHYGYGDENIRRGRFQRNIDLMRRDREKWPERYIGKYLWLRDLAQMCIYEMESNGNRVTPEMKKRATEGQALWRELIRVGQLRMAVDGMDYYGLLNKIAGGGFDFGIVLNGAKMDRLDMSKTAPVMGTFANRADVDLLVNAIMDAELQSFDSRYF